jgi:hypothetical protein
MERVALDPSLTPAPLSIGPWQVSKSFPVEWRFLLLALFAGALGAFLHAAQSFASYVGNGTFRWSWSWWYLLRPFVGGILALILYVVLKGALVPGTSGGVTSAYGVVAISALAGLFSKQAIDKLNEVFTVAFRPASTEGDAQRRDKLTPSGAIIDTLEPPNPTASAGTLAFAIIGSGFTPASAAFLDSIPLATKFMTDKRLEVSVPAAQVPTGKSYALTVRTIPPPGASGDVKATSSLPHMMNL